MADGRRDPSFRVVTEDQNTEEQVSHELIFRHFKENKVEIASAITKPFPFFMSLRDHAFISEQKFEHFQETCRNLVPLARVVYDVLNDLEKTFDLSLLKTLFSRANLKAYPDLEEILRSFPDVSYEHMAPQMMNRGDDEEMPELPPGCGGVSCELALQMDEGGEPEEMPRLLPYNTEVFCNSEDSQIANEAAEEVPSEPLCDGEEGDSSRLQMFEREEPQETLCSSSRCEPVPGELENHQMSKEREPDEFASSLLRYDEQDAVAIGNNTTLGKPKMKRKKKKGHNWSGTRIKRKRQQNIHQKDGRPAASQVALSIKKVKMSLRGPAKIRGKVKRQISTGNHPQRGRKIVNIRLLKGGRKRAFSWRKKVDTRPLKGGKRRGPRIPRGKNVNFDLPELPVTCGNVKGTLYKEIYKQGILKKSIQSEDGRWFTLREFEIEGNHAASKNWKLSVRCHGWPLKHLIEKKHLQYLCPKMKKRRTPVSRNKTLSDKHMKNSDDCEVCRDGGTLFCCDTCSRAFHEDCHIPTVEAERTPWSCIFCRIESLGSQQSHPESEILERQMQPEEQLKCEFLLLKVYCCSESSFFAKIPYYYYIGETAQGLKEPMWLDRIKKKLKEQSYPQVQGFVQDMRLIFQNHRASYKYREFGQMGLRLEAEFEKNFKELFAIQETNENS